MDNAVLNIKNLNIGYHKGSKENIVLSNLNLSLNRGELVCVLGANGIGKSTLLRTIAGTQPPISGTIEINDININKISRQEKAKMLGLVYTDRTMAGGLTTAQLVALGRQPHTGFLGILDNHDKEVINRAISDAGISHKADNYIAELSDGERQKSMIAKALAQETPIIILDEPTAFLDVASKIETMRLLHTLAHTSGKSILLSSHDISQSLLLADRLWVVNNDGTITQGVTEEIVLANKLNCMFDNDKIRFDSSIGDFSASFAGTKSCTITGATPTLTYWCSNALRRNGVNITTLAENHITINSPTEITAVINGSKHCINSISELIKIISI